MKTIIYNGTRITLEKLSASEYITEKHKETEVHTIIAEVVAEYRILFSEIKSRKRTAEVCRARGALFAKLRLFGLSYSEIGRICGRTHHAVRFYLTERKPQ